jgi:hypothetical protein
MTVTGALSQVYNIVADFQELCIYPSLLKMITHSSSGTNQMKSRAMPEQQMTAVLTLYI